MSGLGQLAIRILNGGLFMLCAWVGAGAVADVSDQVLAPTVVASAPPTRPEPARRSEWRDRTPILDRNLFGAELHGEKPVPIEDIEDALEDTKLPLRLLGTAATDDPRLSTAAIEDKNGRDYQVVRVGDQLERHRQVEVLAIEPKRVILRNGSKRETLRLDEEEEGATAPRPVARRATPKRTERAGDQRLSDRLQALRERAARNSQTPRSAANLFSGGRPLPKYEDGKMVGLQLTAIQAGSYYQELGFEDGDVITEFNGIEINSNGVISKVLQELQDAESYEIIVNGEKRTFTAEEIDEILDRL